MTSNPINIGSKPLIDRPRSSSKQRPEITRSRSHPASNPTSPLHSPINSPYGSPTDPSSSLTNNLNQPHHHHYNSNGLKSALRHNNKSSSEILLNEPSSYFNEPAEEEEEEVRGRLGGGLTSNDVGHGNGITGIHSSTSFTSSNSTLSVPQGNLSPSLASTYSRRVGFDTFNSGVSLESTGSNTGGGTGVNYSFTLSAKSARFSRSKSSRTFLVGTDLNEYSVHALDWLLSSLTENNDEVVVLRVIEPGSAAYHTWREEMEQCREEAESVLEDVMRKNGESRLLSIIVEFAVGPIEETIHRMIEIYKPDSLIVGTRGKPDSVWKSAFMGSISKYCVARSPVPVVVVRPEDKVKESLERRLQEPKKRSYLNLLKPHNVDLVPANSSAGGANFLRTNTTPITDKRKSMELERGAIDKEMKRFGTVG